MNIYVHIERLILDGLPVEITHGPIVQTAVETELSRLLAEQSLDRSRTGVLTRLPGGSIPLAHGGGPILLGHHIAQAVYKSLTPTMESANETHLRKDRH
jgi:hypothetical protein